ncbi:MAG: molybdenum cofactor biosynthesis protein [Solirubrobacterales bacterium]
MELRVRLFAVVRERAGAGEITVERPEGATVADLRRELAPVTGPVECLVAVNREYAADESPLAPGDEVALVPPVSGGGPFVAIGPEPVSVDELLARVADPRAGAIVTFSGVTREVEALEYEAYEEMARREMEEIVSAAIEAHGLCAAAAAHRTGSVALGEASVVVAASAPHRPEAFAGAREIIDRLKERATIWKAEVEGAERRWVEGELPPGPGSDG